MSKQYPKVDFSNVIVLHEGQKRVPDSTKLCLFIGGLAALILGVVALLQYKK